MEARTGQPSLYFIFPQGGRISAGVFSFVSGSFSHQESREEPHPAHWAFFFVPSCPCVFTRVPPLFRCGAQTVRSPSTLPPQLMEGVEGEDQLEPDGSRVDRRLAAAGPSAVQPQRDRKTFKLDRLRVAILRAAVEPSGRVPVASPLGPLTSRTPPVSCVWLCATWSVVREKPSRRRRHPRRRCAVRTKPKRPASSMVTELITCSDQGKTKSGPKSLKGAMKVIKKLKGRIGLGIHTHTLSLTSCC